ncbi:MAG: hypothetical protein ACUVUG_03850 [Candidatus Aminicenantia bacterium]
MKRFSIFISVLFLSFGFLSAQAPNSLDSILVYKGETPGTGPGVSVLKLSVGEELELVAKGVDSEGKEVLIAPTWKADKEIALIAIEGKGRCIKIRLKEAPSVAAYITVVVIRDDGKKVSTDIAVEVKK